jgi:uncharacterized protein with NAD-binding domain and iron-sulfur cluster
MQPREYDVIVIGAGPAGLSAAQELAEKKLKVCILEAAPYIGGKLISSFIYPLKPPAQSVPNDELEEYLNADPLENTTVSKKLPIEHGFRVYPENYNNFLSIMRRIKTKDGTAADHLTNEIRIASYVDTVPENKTWFKRFLSKMELALFGLALYTPYLVCKKRSMKYDDISIVNLFRLEKRSKELQEVIRCLTDSLSSGMLDSASSLAVVNILMNYYYAPDRTGFRTFDRPTHLALLKPWEAHLKSLGVEILTGRRVIQLNLSGTEENAQMIKVNEIVAMHGDEKEVFKSKYVITAVPADSLLKIITQNYDIIRYDARLLEINKIITLPATGVQLFYETPIKGLEKKLLAGSMVTHPWALSYVDQTTYWKEPEKYAGSYGVISIYLAITNQTGRYIKKPFQKCTANEIAYEMFTEIEDELKKRNLAIPKRIGYFAHSYQQKFPIQHEDDSPQADYHYNGNFNEDLLHLCVVGMHKWRPVPETVYLGNLLLAGAYTKSNSYYVSTMEAASESGRRAANQVLAQFNMPGIPIYDVQIPTWIKIYRGFDRILYSVFLPNPLEILLKLLQKTLNNTKTHMSSGIRSYEDLHW